MTAKIVLTKRNNDIFARLNDDPKISGSGKTAEEAVFSLIRTHEGKLGLKIEWDITDPVTARFFQDLPPSKR